MIHQHATELCADLAQAWRPPEKLTLSDWAERNYFLETGSIRLTKFQAGILDALLDPSVKEIAVMKSARVGLTMSLDIFALYCIANGEQVGYVLPRDQDAKQHAPTVFQQSLDRCPAVVDLKTTKGRDTMQEKTFANGATVKFLAAVANSARRHNLTVVQLDEVDAYNSDHEGDILSLMKRRVAAAIRSKIVITSTPVGKNSNINREYLRGDQRKFHCPCPQCGEYIELLPEGLHVQGVSIMDLPPSALETLPKGWTCEYVCQSCGGIIDERDKRNMTEAGEWRPTATDTAEDGVISFKINALISPFPAASWKNIATEVMQASDDPMKMRTVVNTVFGDVYSESLDDNLDPEELRKRAGPTPALLPDDVLYITAGVDIGPTYADVLLMGHGEKSHRVLEMARLEGDVTAGNELFNKIDNWLAREYKHELGGTLRCSVVGIDSGFATSQVYQACEARVGSLPRWVPLKGIAGDDKPIISFAKQRTLKELRTVKLRNVGTFQAKTWLITRLNQTGPEEAGYIHLPEPPAVPDRFFEEIIAEERIETVNQKGMLKIEWRPRSSRVRSESMDCCCYAYSVLIESIPNWQALKEQLAVHPSDLRRVESFAELGQRLNGDKPWFEQPVTQTTKMHH